MIHSTAIVDSKAKIHHSVIIGPHCIIGACEIGEGSRINAFSIVKDGSILGKNVIIREYCHIGGIGFIFPRDEQGHLIQTPHISIAILEDYVELFPYTNVDRGTVFETRIKKGTKIDHYCHIGHSVTLGKHCVVAANTVFAGESILGDYSFMGVGAVIKPKTRVGSNCLVGAGAVVMKDVDDGWLAYGNPAKMIRKNDRGFLS